MDDQVDAVHRPGAPVVLDQPAGLEHGLHASMLAARAHPASEFRRGCPLAWAAVTDFAGDTTTELQRKAKALSVVSLIETCSYLLLFYIWQIAKSDVGTAIVGSLHGMIWLAFCAMVIMIAPALKWTWGLLRGRDHHRTDRRGHGLGPAPPRRCGQGEPPLGRAVRHLTRGAVRLRSRLGSSLVSSVRSTAR